MGNISGELRKTPTGLYTYDMEGDPILVFPLATLIQKKFGLEAGKFPAIGLDEVLVELTYNNIPIIVGWDIWSDLFVMAMDQRANFKVKEIAEYLSTKLIKLGKLEDKLLAEQKKKEEK